MFKYAIWVRINQLQTANTIIYADNDYQAKQLSEALYGIENVFGYSRLT